MKTEKDYGRYMIVDSGHFEYDPNLDEYYDFEKYGREHIAQEEGQFNEYGYVSYHGILSIDELMMEEPNPDMNMEMGGM